MYALAALLLLILDQTTKYWVINTLPMGEPIPVLPPLVYFTYVRNPGAAFTILANRRWIFVSVAVLVGLSAWFYRKFIAAQNRLFKWGITLALSGAAGNFVDRLRFGKVIDFVDLRVWPVFNVADSCIVIGVGLLIWTIMRSEKS